MDKVTNKRLVVENLEQVYFDEELHKLYLNGIEDRPL